jgi:hypothetical protein
MMAIAQSNAAAAIGPATTIDHAIVDPVTVDPVIVDPAIVDPAIAVPAIAARQAKCGAVATAHNRSTRVLLAWNRSSTPSCVKSVLCDPIGRRSPRWRSVHPAAGRRLACEATAHDRQWVRLLTPAAKAKPTGSAPRRACAAPVAVPAATARGRSGAARPKHHGPECAPAHLAMATAKPSVALKAEPAAEPLRATAIGPQVIVHSVPAAATHI